MKEEYVKTIRSMQSKIEDERIFIIKGNTDYALEEECIDKLFKDSSIIYDYHKYDSTKLQEAYCPFMDFIRRIYFDEFSNEMSINDFIDNCNVYSLQKIIFTSYLKNKKTERKEPRVLGEIKYDEKRFIDSIISIIKFICKTKKIFLILDGFQGSNSSVIKLIDKIINGQYINNFGLLVYYNENSKKVKYIESCFNKMMISAATKDIVLDYGNTFEDISKNANSIKINDCKDYDFNDSNAEEEISNMINLINMLAIGQVKYYLEHAYKKIEKESINISNKNKKIIIYMLIVVNVYDKYASNLMIVHKKEYYYIKFLCDELRGLCESEDDLMYFYYNYALCMISHIENNKDEAYKYYMACKEYAKRKDNKDLDFQADLIYCFFLTYDKTVMTRRKEKITDKEIKLIEEVKRRGYTNNLTYLYMYSYENDDETIEKITNGELDFVYLEKAIDLARKNDNKFFLELAYGRKSTIFNSTKIDDMLFEKDVDMQREIGLELDNPKYSFKAYRYTMNEEFLLSHKTNNELLIKMYRSLLMDGVIQNLASSDNIMEFLLAVYNMSVNCMCAEEYYYAIEYLSAAIKELELLNSFDLALCDLTKLYGMIAYCYYEEEMDYKCSLYLYKLKNIINFVFKYDQEEIVSGKNLKVRRDTMFLYHVTVSLCYIKDKKMDEAFIELKSAYKYFQVEKGQWPFMHPIMTKALYKYYMEVNDEEKAKQCLLDCIKYCDENLLIKMKEKMECLLNKKEYKKASYDFTLKGLTKEEMFTVLMKNRMEVELDNNIKDFNFIALWNNNLNSKEADYEKTLKSSMNLIKNYLNINDMIYLSINDKNDISISYSNIIDDISKKDLLKIYHYFNNIRRAFITKRTSSRFISYKKMMDIFKNDEILAFVGIPIIKNDEITNIFIAYTTISKTGIKNDDIIEKSRLNTLSIVLNQLVDAERIYNSGRKLSVALDRANEANKAKSVFLANMSHEIRTPLNAVLGMDEMIIRECKNNTITDYAYNIRSSGKALLSIINEILDFSKIESGKMEIVDVEYDASSILYDLYNMVLPRVEKKDLKLYMDIPEDMPYKLYGDDIRVRQIILNILTNAVKYTEKGSVTLKVSYENCDEDNIIISVAVIDTGIGIKNEDMPKLFESFGRLDLKKNRSIEGTGLGMGITVKLLNMMGSKLNVESVYGKGSTFSFKLKQKVISRKPMGNFKVKAENTLRENEKYTKQFIAPEAKILVVDDNDMNRAVIKNLLKSTKVNVTTLESGFECLKEVKKNKYDIIFLDHMMPEMDGIETLANLKLLTNNLNKDVPVIALTANAISGAKAMYLEKGFNDYLSKPIDYKKLEELLIKYLPKELIKLVDASKEETTDTEKPVLWDSVTGLDIGEAMKHNPDKESFNEMVKMYYDSIESKANLLEELEKKEDIENYTINVHALKSSSKLIGATVVSELAANLEALGKEKNIEEIHKENDLLLSIYRKYRKFLKVYVGEDDNKKEEVNKEILINKLSLVSDYISNFDLDNADKVMKELDKFEISDKVKDDYNKLKDYVLNFKVEETPVLVSDMIKKLN